MYILPELGLEGFNNAAGINQFNVHSLTLRETHSPTPMTQEEVSYLLKEALI